MPPAAPTAVADPKEEALRRLLEMVSQASGGGQPGAIQRPVEGAGDPMSNYSHDRAQIQLPMSGGVGGGDLDTILKALQMLLASSQPSQASSPPLATPTPGHLLTQNVDRANEMLKQ